MYHKWLNFASLHSRENLRKLYRQDKSLFERVMDWLKGLIADVKAAGKNLSDRSKSWAQMDALAADEAQLQGLYDVMESIMQSEVKGSERSKPFNGVATEKQVRHSMSEYDSTGATLSSEQQAYFADSKIRDEQGRLMVMYHGTPSGNYKHFRSGTYFTPNREYADVYQNPGASSISYGKKQDAPTTFAMYLNMEKPFDTRNPKERSIFMKEYYRKYGTGAPLSESGLPDWTDGMDLQEFIEEMEYDYDGLILDEGGVPDGDGGVKSRGLSYVIFDPAQAKAVDNKTPTEDKRFRYAKSDIVHTPEQLQIMQEYAAATDKQLLEAANMYENDKHAPNKRLEICGVSQRMAEDINNLLGIDVHEYTVNIDRSGFNHIIRRHGKNGEHDHSMSNSKDIARMGYVLENYDHIEVLRNQNSEPVYSYSRINKEGKPAPVLLLRKRIDGEYYLSEAIVDSSWKKIWVQSAYIKKAGDYATAEDGSAPQLTSETPNASLSDTKSIAQENRRGNEKFSMSDFASAYSAAVEQGDTDKAKELVAQAAEASMPDSKLRTPDGKQQVTADPNDADENTGKKFSLSDYDATVKEGDVVLEDLLTMTAAHKMTDAEARRVAQKALKAGSSTMDADDAARQIKSIFDYASRSRKVDVDGMNSEVRTSPFDLLPFSRYNNRWQEGRIIHVRIECRAAGNHPVSGSNRRSL